MAPSPLSGRGFDPTEAQRHEAILADFLAMRWRCDIEHLGQMSVIDWIAKRDGREVAAIEVKVRDVPFLEYPTGMVPPGKIIRLQEYEARTRVPGFLVCFWTDPAIGYCRAKGVDPSMAGYFGAWRDRGGVRVPQRSVLIPRKTFKLLTIREEDHAALKGLPGQGD
jgi:hypothetical protein